MTTKAKAATVRWAVFNVLHLGGRRTYRPLLELSMVPEGTPRRAVIAALEGAGAAARFSDGGVAWANHVVLPEPRWPKELEWNGRSETWTWEGLEGAQEARNITLVLPPTEYAAVVLAARGAGESINGWCRRTLAAGASR